MSEPNDIAQFSQLTDVELREAWSHEANDFTPWLAENLDRLSEVIGVQIEPEGTEVRVGDYSADILARDPDGKRVLIENQLEWSDHTHLGQILTYLAGLDARTVIWIARNFNETHLSAFRWLNENSGDDLNPFDFFAVRLRVVRIDDSKLVPVFEIVEKPNHWDRQIRVATRNSGPRAEIFQTYREFWTHYSQRHPGDAVRENHGQSNYWINRADDAPRISMKFAFGAKNVGIFFTSRAPRISNEDVLAWLEYRSAIIEEILGTSLNEQPEGLYQEQFFETEDRGNWDAIADWLHEKLQLYLQIIDAEAEK